jgi:hypothetical protein
MKKNILPICLLAAACLVSSSCSALPRMDQMSFSGGETSSEGEYPENELPFSPAGGTVETATPVPEEDRDASEGEDTWAIYWYLCGSDLESAGGYATMDLEEMMDVSLPEEVQVVIQTGGASAWQNSVVSADSIGRYLYSSDGLFQIDQLPQANMGAPETLADFLTFCRDQYPADHTMVLFWNHGGGSVSGVAFDENFGRDSLTLSEMYAAFSAVYPLSEEDPPFELIGFDACLMATVDTAYTFYDVASYMVASEESEPALGWSYGEWLNALASDPSMDGGELGRFICDSYAVSCAQAGLADEITLSVADLSKASALVSAYEMLGSEALLSAADEPAFFSYFGRAAASSENYGGNTPEQGFTNMVDLGDLVENSSGILPETSQLLLDALEECVIYQVTGPYREEATGLSCYYPYGGSFSNYLGYIDEGCSTSFKYLYEYGLTGEMPEAGMEYLDELGFQQETLPDVPSLDAEEDLSVYVDDDGYAVLDIGPELANRLQGVYFRLAYMDEENDISLFLGRDNDLYADWENGVFMDNFRGVWGSIDGHFVYMDLAYEGDDYNTYSVPILLNGEEYSLRVVYDYNDACYYILGARKGIDENGMADRNLIRLQPGDQITTIHYAATVFGDDAYAPYETETFTVTENTSFEEEWMGDGSYIMLFELIDASSQTIFSEPVIFTIEDGEIYTGTV